MKKEEDLVAVVDVFAGAGGLSLGAARAGFRVVSAIEIDPCALETHSRNFPNAMHISMDARSLEGERLLEESGIPQGSPFGMVGGPPCQGFSSMGRMDPNDVRNDLFVHFFRLVEEARPIFFVAENVPSILNSRFDRIRARAFERVPDYRIFGPIIVRGVECGVPTVRKRVFFVGFDSRVVDWEIAEESFDCSFETPESCIKARDALFGLPEAINPDWISEESGWRRFLEFPFDSFFGERVGGCVPPGVGSPRDLDRFFSGWISGCMGTRHTREVEERYRRLEPGEIDAVSKAVRLRPDGFCPTLRAGTGSDKGSHQAVRPIHYEYPRVITVREAARLQGFPDWFVFHRTKWHSFRQIGNSVSPIVAERIFRAILRNLSQSRIWRKSGYCL